MASRLLTTLARRPALLTRPVLGPARRFAHAEAHGHKPQSDMMWLIPSVVVFGSTAVYLLAPPSKPAHGDHHAHAAAASHHDTVEHKAEEPEEPATPPSGEVADEEVKESVEKSLKADVPKAALAEEVKDQQ